MARPLEKVTAFVIRCPATNPELLLLKHPYAGMQIPAGTVEAGESPAQAVLLEVFEETGLTDVTIRAYLGAEEASFPPETRFVLRRTHVYARPDATSFDWAYLRRGIMVTAIRHAGEFTQITYTEHDREPDPEYVTMQITGWAPNDALTTVQRRHFFLLDFAGQTEERWQAFSDNHTFTLFWAPLAALPDLIHPQDQWLAWLKKSIP
ncbi:MAG: NUDIX domain-containing protein [Anaerolineae bacterium]|nr:NUDIX domain-containing protein [Anaerolineae bacterium]